MRHPFLFLSIPLLLLVLFSVLDSLDAAQTNSTDQAALVAFWNGLTNPQSLDWNTRSGLCGQTYITCQNEKVVEFAYLGDDYLAGTLATQLGQLTALTYL